MEENKPTTRKLLEKIEKEGEEMLHKLKDSKQLTDKSLLGLMQTGEKEFIKKTGRQMTYLEMYG